MFVCVQVESADALRTWLLLENIMVWIKTPVELSLFEKSSVLSPRKTSRNVSSPEKTLVFTHEHRQKLVSRSPLEISSDVTHDLVHL